MGSAHCADVERGKKEHFLASQSIHDALTMLPRHRRIVISLEMLIALGRPYLADVLQDIGYKMPKIMPTLVNSNRHYMSKHVLEVLTQLPPQDDVHDFRR